jgi:hypothetical protein
MTNKIISNKYALLTATVVSAMMLATSAVPSLFPTTAAYAEEVVVEPTLQTDVETEVNVDVDPDVHISDDCEDLNGDNEEVEQIIELPVNQKDHNDNEGDIVVEPTVQTAVQTGLNVIVSPDVFVILGCDDDDTVEVSDEEEVTQITDEPTIQEATSDSEGDLLISPDIQTTRETGINYRNDKDVVAVVPS